MATWTINTNNIYINEKPIYSSSGGGTLFYTLSPLSEINISNVTFKILNNKYTAGRKYKIIPKVQFIKNGNVSGWATLIDASENIIPVPVKYYGDKTQNFARFVKVKGDTGVDFETHGRRKQDIDQGTAYNHNPLSKIDYPGVLHFTPELGSQEIRNFDNVDKYKLVKKILTKDATLEESKFRLSINAMNWITRGNQTSSNDIANNKQDFIDFRLKFGIYEFNKKTGEYNDELNEIFSTEENSANSSLKDTIFRIYLSPNIINNDSLKYMTNVFGKDLSTDIYTNDNRYYSKSFVWNTNKNPLSGKILFNNTNFLKDYTNYDGIDYRGYYSESIPFYYKVLNKYKFKAVYDDDIRLIDNSDNSERREFLPEKRYTVPEYVYKNIVPKVANLSNIKNMDFKVTSYLGYEVLEFSTGARTGETYYYPYYAKDLPDDDSIPQGYYNTKDSREQNIYHYIAPKISGIAEYYQRIGESNYRDLVIKNNIECISYNDMMSFKFTRNLGRWISSVNNGDKYVIKLKFTYKLPNDTQDRIEYYYADVFKGSTDINAYDAEEATTETIIDLPEFSTLLPNIEFSDVDYIKLNVQAFYTHCFGKSDYGYTDTINNYVTEEEQIFNTTLRLYETLLLTEETPNYVFYNSKNTLLEPLFQSNEDMEVDWNTFKTINCIKVNNINVGGVLVFSTINSNTGLLEPFELEVYEDFSKTSKICDITFNSNDEDYVTYKLVNTTSTEIYIFNKNNEQFDDNCLSFIPITNIDTYNKLLKWTEPAIAKVDENLAFRGCMSSSDIKLVNTNEDSITLYKYIIGIDYINSGTSCTKQVASAIYTPLTQHWLQYLYYFYNNPTNKLPAHIVAEEILCDYGEIKNITVPQADQTNPNGYIVVLLCDVSSDDNLTDNLLIWRKDYNKSLLFDKSNIETGEVTFTINNNINNFKVITNNLVPTDITKSLQMSKTLDRDTSPPYENHGFYTYVSSGKSILIYRIKANTTYYFSNIASIVECTGNTDNFSIYIQLYTKDGTMFPFDYSNYIYAKENNVVKVNETTYTTPLHNSFKDANDNILGDPYYMEIKISATSENINEALKHYLFVSENPPMNIEVGENLRVDALDNNLYKYTWTIPKNVLDKYKSNIDYNIKFLPVSINQPDKVSASDRAFITKKSISQSGMNLKYVPNSGISGYKTNIVLYSAMAAQYSNIDYISSWTSTIAYSIPTYNNKYVNNLIQEIHYKTENHYSKTIEQMYLVKPNTWYVITDAESVEFYRYATKQNRDMTQLYMYKNTIATSGKVTSQRPTNSTNIYNNTSKKPLIAYSGASGNIMVIKTTDLVVVPVKTNTVNVFYEDNNNYDYNISVYDIPTSNADYERLFYTDDSIKHLGYIFSDDVCRVSLNSSAWQGTYINSPSTYLNKGMYYSALAIYKANTNFSAYISKDYKYLPIDEELRTGLPEYNSFRFVHSLDNATIKYPKLYDLNEYSNILDVFDNSNSSMILNSPYDNDFNTYIETIRPGIYTHAHEEGQTDPYNPDYSYSYYDVPKLVHTTQGYDNIKWKNIYTSEYHFVIGDNGLANVASCQNILIYNNNLHSYGLYVDLYDGYGNKVNNDPIEIPNNKIYDYINLSEYGVDIYKIDIQEQDENGHLNISYILYNDYILDSLDVNKFDKSDSTFIYNYDSSRKQLNYKFDTNIVPSTNNSTSKYYNLQFEWYKKLFVDALGLSITIPYKNFVPINLNRIRHKYISIKDSFIYANSNMDDTLDGSPDFIPGENYIKYKNYFDSYGLKDFSIQNSIESTQNINYPEDRQKDEIIPLNFYDDLFSLIGLINYKINYYIKHGLIKISQLPNEAGEIIPSIFVLADFHLNVTISSGNIDIITYTSEGYAEKLNYTRLLYNNDYSLEDDLHCCYAEFKIKDTELITIDDLLRWIDILPTTYQKHKCSVLRIPTTKNYTWYNRDVVDLTNNSYVYAGKEILFKSNIIEPESISSTKSENIDNIIVDNTGYWTASNISDTITYTFNEDKVINNIYIKVKRYSNYFIQLQYKNSNQTNYNYVTDEDGSIITFKDFDNVELNIKTFKFKDIIANKLVISFMYVENSNNLSTAPISDDKYYYIAFSNDSYNSLEFIDSSNITYVNWGCVPGLFPVEFKSDVLWTNSSYYKEFVIGEKTYKIGASTNMISYINGTNILYNSNIDRLSIPLNRNVAEIIPMTSNISVSTVKSTEIIEGGTKDTFLYTINIENISSLLKYNYYTIPICVINWIDFEHSDDKHVNKHYLYFNFYSDENNSIYPIYSALDSNWMSAAIYHNNNNLKVYDFNDSDTRFSLVNVDSKEIYIIFKNNVTKYINGYNSFYYLDIDTEVFSDISIPVPKYENIIKIKLSDKSKKVNSFRIKDKIGLIHNIAIYDRFGEGEEPNNISIYTNPQVNWNSTINNIKTSINYINENIYKVYLSDYVINNFTVEILNGYVTMGTPDYVFVLILIFDDSATLSNTNKGIISNNGHTLNLIVSSDLRDKETTVKIQINDRIEYIYILNANYDAILTDLENRLINNSKSVYKYDITSINNSSRVKVGNATIDFNNSGIGTWTKRVYDTSKTYYDLLYKFYLLGDYTNDVDYIDNIKGNGVSSIQDAQMLLVELDTFTQNSGFDFSVSNAYWNNNVLQITKHSEELMTYNIDDEYAFPQKGILNNIFSRELEYPGTVLGMGGTYIVQQGIYEGGYQIYTYETECDIVNPYITIQLDIDLMTCFKTSYYTNPTSMIIGPTSFNEFIINIVTKFYDDSNKTNLLFEETNNLYANLGENKSTFSLYYDEITKVKYIEIIFTFENKDSFVPGVTSADSIEYNIDFNYSIYSNSIKGTSLNNTYIINNTYNEDEQHNKIPPYYDTMTNKDESDNLTIVNKSANNPDVHNSHTLYRDLSGDVIHLMKDED